MFCEQDTFQLQFDHSLPEVCVIITTPSSYAKYISTTFENTPFQSTCSFFLTHGISLAMSRQNVKGSFAIVWISVTDFNGRMIISIFHAGVVLVVFKKIPWYCLSRNGCYKQWNKRQSWYFTEYLTCETYLVYFASCNLTILFLLIWNAKSIFRAYSVVCTVPDMWMLSKMISKYLSIETTNIHAASWNAVFAQTIDSQDQGYCHRSISTALNWRSLDPDKKVWRSPNLVSYLRKMLHISLVRFN